ncbi:phage tail tape measure protein [Bacillus idriensis]|uniref:Phage tail tape measure protein n=1 Tax=Metabacillus idriensis TaxID=324768 RepID=A0A6I2M8R3_9BACI|nr:phage tail tape measure protein [Metabacillus idriensis]MRX54705.1 phage tail tape measure protein [Metabacillus idriensis]
MAGNNHNIKIDLRAIDNFSSVMGQLDNQLNNAENGMNRLQAASGAVGKALGAMGIAVGAGLVFAVDKAAKFEHAMSSVSAVSGASGEEMSKLTALAKEMGATTSFSANEAAKGIEELMKAGVKTSDIIGGGLKGALDLAVAGELELAEAAEISSTALNAFKNDNLTVTDAANILSGAANSSATSVHELRYSLSMVSAVASGLGLTFEDTNAALAVLANNGLKGSDAGTSLKTALSRLNPMTEKAYGQMKDLGIITEDGSNKFFDAEGNVRSMADIAGVLQEALKGLTAQQKQSALYTMFGSDAIRAGLILSKEGAKGIEEMTAAMSKVTAAEVAAERLNNFKGSLTILKSALEGAAIALGSVFLPALTSITKSITAVVSKFTQLPASIQGTIAVGAAIAAVFMLIAGALILIMPGIMATVSAFGLLAAPMAAAAAAAAPIIAAVVGIIAALALIGVALVTAYQKVDWFRVEVDAAWAAIKNAWNIALVFIQQIASQVMTAVTAFIGEKLAQIKAFWAENGAMIMEATRNVFNIIKTIITVALDVIWAVMQFIWPAVKFLIVSTWDAIKGVISGALNVILGAIKFFAALFTGDWSAMWDATKQIIKGALEFVWNLISLIMMGKILGAIKSFGALAGGLFKALWTGIKAIFTAGLNAIKSLVTTVFNAIKSIIQASMSGVTGVISSAWSLIRSIFSTVVGALRTILTSGFSGMRSAVSSAMSAIKSTITSMWGSIKSYFASIDLFSIGYNIIKGLMNGMTSMAGSLMQKAKSIAGSITKTIKGALNIHSPSRVMVELGGYTTEGLAVGMMSELKRVQSAAGKLATSAVPSMSSGYNGGQSVRNASARPSVTNNTPINVTLNYSGSGSADDAQGMLDFVSRGLERQFGNQARVGGVKLR